MRPNFFDGERDHFVQRCGVRCIRSHPESLIAQHGERLIDIRLRTTKDRDTRAMFDGIGEKAQARGASGDDHDEATDIVLNSDMPVLIRPGRVAQ